MLYKTSNQKNIKLENETKEALEVAQKLEEENKVD